MKKVLKYISLILCAVLTLSAFAGCEQLTEEQQRIKSYQAAFDELYSGTHISSTQQIIYKNTQKNITVEREEKNELIGVYDKDRKLVELSSLGTVDYGESVTSVNMYFDGAKMYLEANDNRFVSDVDKQNFNAFYNDNILRGETDSRLDLTRFNTVSGTTDKDGVLTINYSEPTDDYKPELYNRYKQMIQSELSDADSISQYSGEVKIDKEGKLLSEKNSFTAKKSDEYFLECEMIFTVTSTDESLKAKTVSDASLFKTVESVPGLYIYASSAVESFDNGQIYTTYDFISKEPMDIVIKRTENVECYIDTDGKFKYDYEYNIQDIEYGYGSTEKTTGSYNGERVSVKGGKGKTEKQSQNDAKLYVLQQTQMLQIDLAAAQTVSMSREDGKYVVSLTLKPETATEYVGTFLKKFSDFKNHTALDISAVEYTVTLQNGEIQRQTSNITFSFKSMGRTYKATLETDRQIGYGNIQPKTE